MGNEITSANSDPGPGVSISSTEELSEFCQSHGIRRFSIFGSMLRPDFRSDSDIDVLVEFENGRIPGLFGIADMESELSNLFGGRKVDIRTPEDLSHYFRKQVLDAAQVQYARG